MPGNRSIFSPKSVNKKSSCSNPCVPLKLWEGDIWRLAFASSGLHLLVCMYINFQKPINTSILTGSIYPQAGGPFPAAVSWKFSQPIPAQHPPSKRRPPQRVGFFLLDGIGPGIILQSPLGSILREEQSLDSSRLSSSFLAGLIWSWHYFPETPVVQPGGMASLWLQPTQHLLYEL